MNKKPILMVLIVLFVVSAVLGSYGLILSKKTNVTPEVIKPKIAYEYYLEDEIVTEMPTNTEENEYKFSKYECDNNMIVNFDEETWNYTTSNEKDGTCKLYFVKANYKVELTITNGLVNGEESSFTSDVERETDGQFNITPNEGYEYDGSVTCSNDKEAIYDVSTNMLTISSISEDVACKIDFNKRVLKVEIVVKNGTGSTTEDKEYGESISAIVQPNDGFEKAKIACTNNQVATYENNKLTIQKLTDNTVCNVTFSKTPVVTYNLIIDTLPEQVVITSGNKKQSIVSGKDGKFSLRAADGYQIVLDCNGIKPSNEKEDPDGTITYTFLGVSRNITCNITAKESDVPTNTGE